MQGKGKTNRKRHVGRFLPFPVASVSTILLIVLLVSTLSALFVGAVRRNHGVVMTIDYPSNPITSGGSIVGSSSNIKSSQQNNERNNGPGPSIRSLQDLTSSELHPQAGPERHIVSPPRDEYPVTLVTCRTTAGYLHILVHPSWAPLGAQRFLQMVKTEYFSSKVALMRCIKHFLCQFGIAGDPSLNAQYGGKNNLKDDPNWLPEGPSHRKNELGVKRFAKGYLAFAGGGKNSRTNQLIVALDNNERLGGGESYSFLSYILISFALYELSKLY